ncbi:MAG TPA: S1C family serine protease [Gemmatimonadaceae bacterium]
MSIRRSVLRVAALGAVLLGAPGIARAQASSAYSLDDIAGLLRSHVPSRRILALARENCLSFTMTPAATARLKRAGATASLLKGLAGVCDPDHPKVDGASADSARSAAAGSAGAQVAAAPAAPVDSNVSVKIRAAVVGADLTVRPVPQLDLIIISPRGDTTHTSTDLEGTTEGTFKEGVYRIESVIPVEIGGSRYRWGFYQQFTKDMRPIELTQKNAMVEVVAQAPPPAPAMAPAESSATGATVAAAPADSQTTAPSDSTSAAKPEIAEPPKPVRHVSTEKELFDKYRSGLFTLYGMRRGTAWLADTSGLVVTNAHLLAGATEVRVQVDSATKVYARPVVVDDAHDIAVLAINMRNCAGCAALPLFDSTKTVAPAAGDRVLALGSPLNRLAVFSTGIVSNADDRAVVSDVSVGRLNTGGPLVNMDGFVVGLNTNRETDLADDADARVATSVPASALAQALAGARDSLPALAARPVTDSLLPVVPSDPFPQAPIAAVSALPQMDLRPYRAGAGSFRMLVMTPQIMAWREKQAKAALAAAKAKDPRKAARWTRIDPIEGWRDWDDYLDERRAVVIVNVGPEQTEFPYYEPDKMPSIGEGSVADMKIYRDGVEIIPVEKVRVPAVLNVAEMRAAGRPIPMQAVYVYRIVDFAPRAVGTVASYKVTITDASTGRQLSLPLMPSTIEQLWKDFRPYQFAR